MGVNTLVLFLTFSSLTLLSLIIEERRNATLSRTKEEWTIDILGLFIQGIIIPAFPFLLVPILKSCFPALAGSMEISPFLQFVLSFVMVDYLYYWNHRFFHRRSFWAIHRLHHSSRYLDIFATSRNSFVTSFLFVYVWSQVVAMFLLKDSTAFMLGLGVTFALDLWRHSGMKQPTFIHVICGWFLILPEQHVLHHSLIGRTKNYGANLCWWDKLHGTYSSQLLANQNLEKLSEKRIWNELLTPWRTR